MENTTNPTPETSVADDFEALMQQRLNNTATQGTSAQGFTDSRLQEMNKKLPNWNLEPPTNFVE